MRIQSWLLAAALGGVLTSPALADTTKEISAPILAATCSTCHGVDGTGSGNIPAIKDRPALVLENQLKGFKSGQIPSTVMGRLAKGFSDAELEALAKHFGAK